jgi:hypothetical protein
MIEVCTLAKDPPGFLDQYAGISIYLQTTLAISLALSGTNTPSFLHRIHAATSTAEAF